jgi:hypothetical protein
MASRRGWPHYPRRGALRGSTRGVSVLGSPYARWYEGLYRALHKI